MWLWLYKNLMRLSTPFLGIYLQGRAARGKEDPARTGERRGIASRPRGTKPLVWFHGASVGEAQSLLTLVNRLLESNKDIEAMVTTGTVTSARLMAERLPARAFHQYIPVDHPDWVARFLDHWRPDLVVWSESELWPNMLTGVKRRNIPAVLVNARLSEKSFSRWQWAKGSAKRVLSAFSLCLAQNEAEAKRLIALGAAEVKVSGNLKYAARPLPAEAHALHELKQATDGRPLVLWASTHPGEEEIACRVHLHLQQQAPRLLSIIVPRHPQRGGGIAHMAGGLGLKASLRGQGLLPADSDDIYIADTLGETGVFYRLSPSCMIGGSFVPHGGHNPIEPAQLGCLIFYGPHMFNFTSICHDFESHNAAVRVDGEAALTAQLSDLLQDPSRFAPVAKAAQHWVKSQAHIADGICDDLSAIINRVGKGAA